MMTILIKILIIFFLECLLYTISWKLSKSISYSKLFQPQQNRYPIFNEKKIFTRFSSSVNNLPSLNTKLNTNKSSNISNKPVASSSSSSKLTSKHVKSSSSLIEEKTRKLSTITQLKASNTKTQSINGISSNYMMSEDRKVNVPYNSVNSLRIDLNNGDEELGYQSGAFKSGFISIIGNPNVGKSTLMNAILNQSLSIVSPKPQTTRHRILGVVTEKNYQLIFSDTPGIMNKTVYKLQDAMMDTVNIAAGDADVILLVTDVYGQPLQNEKILKKLLLTSRPIVVAINKVDMLSNTTLASYTSNNEDFYPSIKKNDGSAYNSTNIRIKTKLDLKSIIQSKSSMDNTENMNNSINSKSITGIDTVEEDDRDHDDDNSSNNSNISNVTISDSIPNNLSADEEVEWEKTLLKQSLIRTPILSKSQLVRMWQSRLPHAEILFLSANMSYNIELLKDRLLHYLPTGPKYFPTDLVTNRDERFFTCEIIREAIFKNYKDEIPYSCEVEIVSFKDKSENLSIIEANILVSRDSQKSILIGKGGLKLKAVSTTAREKLEDVRC